MTGINIVIKLFIIIAVIIFSAISPCTPTISDKRLCFDRLCSVQVSEATTVLNYGSNDHDIMSFKSNVEVKVFSKSAGKRPDLWGVEIDGKRGYVPLNLLREKKIYKKQLIHEVPTEDIVANTPSDNLNKHDAKREGDVPNTLAKAEDTQEEIVAVPDVKQNIINDEEIAPSVPELDRVSPSYEILDGTTIRYSQKDEFTKFSYATQTPQGIQSMEQQPTLSIHPNIASTLTLKTGNIPIAENVDDAEKYLEAAGLKDQSLNDKFIAEATTELPHDTVTLGATPPDVNHTSEPNLVDSATNLDAVADGKSGDATEQADVPSSQESVEKATDSSSAKLNDEKNANNIDTSTTDFYNQTSNKVENVALEESLPSDKLGSMTVETSTKAADTELPRINTESKKIDVNQDNSGSVLDNNNNSENKSTEVVVDSGDVGHPRATENLTVAEESKKAEDAEDEEEEEEEEEANENLSDDEEFMGEAEEGNEINAEGNPNHLKITNQFYHRQTSMPDSINNVEKAISSEPEAKDSYGYENSISSEPGKPVDFPTQNNYINEYQTKTGNLIPVEAYLEQDKGNMQAEYISNRLVNSDSNNVNLERSHGTIDDSVETKTNQVLAEIESVQPGIYKEDEKAGFRQNNFAIHETPSFNGFQAHRNLLNVGNGLQSDDRQYDAQRQNEPFFENQHQSTFNDAMPPDHYKEDETASYRQDNYARDETLNFNGSPVNRNLMNAGNGLESNDIGYDAQQQNNQIMEHNPEPTINSAMQPDSYEEDKTAVFHQDNLAMDSLRYNDRQYDSQLHNEKMLENQPEPAIHNVKFADISVASSSELFPIEMSTDIDDATSHYEGITGSPGDQYAPKTVEIKNTVTVTEIPDSCLLDSSCEKSEDYEQNDNFLHEDEVKEQIDEEAGIMNSFTIGRNYWETLTYLVVTAVTTLLFSLGYYYIENTRRDGQLIAKINLLEKELLVANKECTVLDDTLKSTKTKLDSIEDESFGSNEMVVSLKADLEASRATKSELEDQVSMLEKELESATEAGLELERMLREILSTNNQDNPLAQSVEDLQTRLNAQQAANEALTNALNLKAQENETLTAELTTMTKQCEQLEIEVSRATEELKRQNNVKSNLEQTLMDRMAQLERQVKDISAERVNLRKQLKGKDMELKDLLEVVNQMNINNLDFEKLYNVSRVKAEASQLLEERNELQIRLTEVEGAHQLLEEHVKIINEEVSSLSEQCKLAEKAKRDAETRVEVLSNFFKEKEAQRQKEEAVWLQKQGEVSSTVERLQTMQNEIHNYKQQIEMLKREILDQEREYKNQISSLETKSHEHWVVARQNERRLEESKAEAGQLRNRLTLIEKSINDIDPEAKLHRLESNGETATSPQLFIGAEASSSPIMFTGSSGVPFPPPPSYLYGPPPPPFMPPPTHASPGISPYEVGQRPPPLGGRLSSPPPLPGSGSGRYDNPRSPPPPLSPFGPPHRAYPPPFANDRIHPPPLPPPHSSMLPPPLGPSTHSWANESLPHLRNSGFHAHQQHQRDQQRSRNHKGSLHSSGESLDKNV